MSSILTDAELDWISTIMSSIDAEDAERLSVGDVSLTLPQVAPAQQVGRTEALRRIQKEARAKNYLVEEVMGKCKLSQATREVEERRLKKLGRKRKEYKLKSRKHWKQKEKTRKEYNNKLWERDPLSRLKYTFRNGCDITPEEWNRKVAPIWDRYGHKHLKVKTVGGGRMTVHNLVLVYHPPRERYSHKTPKPVVVYYGPDEAVYDSMAHLVKEDSA